MPDVLSSARYEPKLVDPENQNTSHGLTIRLAGRNNRILEIGTSTGYLTKILKDNNNRVTGIEIDREAGELAKQYCESMIIGDVETIDLDAHLNEASFDVIIMGDLLEHLKQPSDILGKVKKYLSPGGYVIVSLPNVCHGDVLLNLVLGDFRYTPLGLLDTMHLRFFGLKNMYDLFSRSGYSPVSINRVTVPVGGTELKVEHDKIPEYLLRFIRSLPESDVYQYVFKAVPDGPSNSIPVIERPLKLLFSAAIEDTISKRVDPLKQEIEQLGMANRKAAAAIESQAGRIAEQNDTIASQESTISALKARVSSLSEELQRASTRARTLEQENLDMQQSIVWRLTMAYHNVLVKRLLPPGTMRGDIYGGVLRKSRAILNKVGGCDRKKSCRPGKAEPVLNAPPRFARTIENQIPSYWRTGQMKYTPLVSLIIVTYNSERCVDDAIDSIAAQCYPAGSLELIIVDNGSRDGTVAAVGRNIEKYRGRLDIRLIDTKKNNGFGRGVNIGVKSSSANAEFIMLINPDCQLYEDTIVELVRAAAATIECGYRLWECRQLPYEHPKHYSPVTLETSWSTGACCLIHKKTFEELGGFDENIFLYMEDVDLSWRMRMHGYKLMYVPFAKVRHDTYQEVHQVKSTQYYNSVLYGFYLRLKYGSFRDIRWYYSQYLWLIINTPNHLPHERRTMVAQMAKLLTLAPKALFFRLAAGKKLKEFNPQFMNHDFDYSREGAFIKTDIDTGEEKVLPRVSIVVRTIGRKGFLREALMSIRNQTYPDVETIVVEDGPATVGDMLEKEFGGMDIKYFALGERQGRCKAGNFGLSKCSGKYLRFLDDDDLLYSTSVETAVYFALKDDGKHKVIYDLSFEVPTKVISEDPLKYEEQDYKLVYNQDFDRKIIIHHNFIPIQNALFDRELYDRFGGFDENLDALEDWDLWIRYSVHTDFLKIPKVTSLYRVPDVSGDIEKRQAKLDMYYNNVRSKYPDLVELYDKE